MKKTNMFSLPCVHMRNWEITNFNLIPRGFSATFRPRAKARTFSSFQLLSIVLSYKVNRQEVLWPDTHPKIAKRNKSCTVRVSQGWPTFFTRFLPFLISQLSYGGRMCKILGEKCRLNLVRARMKRLISAPCWKRKDSRLRRCLNLPQIFQE